MTENSLKNNWEGVNRSIAEDEFGTTAIGHSNAVRNVFASKVSLRRKASYNI